jgi:outer membrane protein TolC
MDVPLGNRTARSQKQVAELRLTRERMRLHRQEQNVSIEVVELQSDLQAAWERFEVTNRQASQTQEWLRLSKLRYADPPPAGNEQNWLQL